MKKLSQHIGEYFLGTETKKFYRNYRSFLREYVTDDKMLKGLINSSKVEETLDLIVGKGIPNLIDLIGVGYSLYTKTPQYSIFAAGEILRLMCTSISGMERKKIIMDILRLHSDISDKLKEVKDRLEDSK